MEVFDESPNSVHDQPDWQSQAIIEECSPCSMPVTRLDFGSMKPLLYESYFKHPSTKKTSSDEELKTGSEPDGSSFAC